MPGGISADRQSPESAFVAEKIFVDTVPKFWSALLAILKRIH